MIRSGRRCRRRRKPRRWSGTSSSKGLFQESRSPGWSPGFSRLKPGLQPPSGTDSQALALGGTLEVCLVDVGQGTSNVVLLGDRRALVIDCGGAQAETVLAPL